LEFVLKKYINMRKTTNYKPVYRSGRLQTTNCSNGFSLVELLVVLSIFSLITAIVVFKNNQFSSSVLLTNLAYETALQVREAQVYGINVKSSGGDFSYPYGVHFEASNDKQIISFVDRNADGIYDSVSPGQICGDNVSECLDIAKIGRGNKIKDFCVVDSSNVESCAATTGISSLDISFKRPNPDAIIRSGIGSYQKAEIYLISADGKYEKTVMVSESGQIVIE